MDLHLSRIWRAYKVKDHVAQTGGLESQRTFETAVEQFTGMVFFTKQDQFTFYHLSDKTFHMSPKKWSVLENYIRRHVCVSTQTQRQEQDGQHLANREAEKNTFKMYLA